MDALEKAAAIFHKRWPKKFAPQFPQDFKGPFELPAPLGAFYARVGPEGKCKLQAPGRVLRFCALRDLWKFQRVSKGSAGWDPDWLAIGCTQQDGDNPFIYSRASGEILFAFCGDETWAPEKEFDNIGQMAITIAAACEYLRENFGKDADNYIALNPGQEDELLAVIGPYFESREAALEALRRWGISQVP